MIGLIQRVSEAKVKVNKAIVGQINRGFVLLLGIEQNDTSKELEQLAKKVAHIRIFEDKNGKMNLSLVDLYQQKQDVKLLVVSQFTLAADTSKGNRPGFSNAAAADVSNALYNQFIEHFESQYCPCEQGEFGANMQVELVNDGPATFYLKT